jgi:protein arginine kinase
MVNSNFRVSSNGWFSEEGPKNDVVISSSINLKRNIEGIVFPEKMNKKDVDYLSNEIFNAVKNMYGYSYYNLNNLKIIERQILEERNYIKQDISLGREQSILIKDNEEVIAIFNENDHIKIKSIKSGLNLRNAYNCCNELDNIFDEKFKFAFSTQFGYLTSDISSAGAGMHASVMLFLPAVRRAGKIDKTLAEIVRSGLVVRGFTDENNSCENSMGDLYIIDNQVSIGKSEEEFIVQLESITDIIAGYERETRNIIIESDRVNIEDEIFRAKGILENCRKISQAEAIRHLSSLKLGKYYNLIDKNITYSQLNCLLLKIQRSHIKNMEDNSSEEILRAEYIRKNLLRTR